MRVVFLALALALAVSGCHATPEAKVAEPVELPKPPPPPAVATIPEMGPANFTMVIDFAVLRSHPAGKQLAVLIPVLPVWRESLRGSSIDVMRDVDWMSIEGPNVYDASYDVVFVHYSASDVDVESAVVGLIKQRSLSSDLSVELGEPDVRGWKLDLRHHSSAFLRPKNDHILAVVPVGQAREQAHSLATNVVRAPKTGRAVDIRATNPHSLAAVMPAAFTDERIWVSPKGTDGATLHLEGDCVDDPSATVAAAELEDGVRKRNTFPVKMATHGLFTPFKATAKGKMVVADLDASAEQLDAILKFTAAAEGASLP